MRYTALAILLSVGAAAWCPQALHAQQLPEANIFLHDSVLHARERSWPFPANGAIDPPALLWPGIKGAGVQYQVRYSPDSLFPAGSTVQSGPLPWATYALHAALAPGAWYWQYASRPDSSAPWQWSPTRRFHITASHSTPGPGAVLERAARAHPRLWGMREKMAAFRNSNRQNPEALALLEQCRRLTGAPLPAEKPTRPRDTTGMTQLQQEKMIEFMFHGFGEKVGQPVRNLCIAYWLSGDERYANEAVRRAMHLSRMDPQGYATRDDFNNGNVMEAMAWAYDMAYERLSATEKAALRAAILKRGSRIYKNLVNRFELQLCDNHVWQHILRNFSVTAMAVAHDAPQASDWLRYVYEVWCARFPVLGSTDGGWHEGNGYFRVHFVSLAYLSLLFGDLSGTDYFATPWMQNLACYLLYSYPPSSASTALGDMHENLATMVKTNAVFAEALSRKVHNPYLNWYVSAIRRQFPGYFKKDTDFLLFRLLTGPAQGGERSPAALPASRTFPDVGLTVMHTQLHNTPKNLMVSLSANPYGASGHGHASQNAFTVNYGGKKIFGGSGFYSNFSDAHNLLHYRSSRAYCTILADSLGQRIGENGYGWMPRHIAGKRIQYTLGDASCAYGPVTAPFWLGHFRLHNIEPSRENGYGDAGVTLYRRHMLLLDSNIIVLYDELKARAPVKWTWQLHSPYEMQASGQGFIIRNNDVFADAQVYTHTPAATVVHQRYNAPAVNWKGKTDDDGNIIPFSEQWHAGVTTVPLQQARFLAILQVGAPGITAKGIRKNGAQWQVGPWLIRAELDGSRAPALYITNTANHSTLHYGAGDFKAGGKTFSHHKLHSTMLVENGKTTEAADTVPDIVKTK